MQWSTKFGHEKFPNGVATFRQLLENLSSWVSSVQLNFNNTAALPELKQFVDTISFKIK